MFESVHQPHCSPYILIPAHALARHDHRIFAAIPVLTPFPLLLFLQGLMVQSLVIVVAVALLLSLATYIQGLLQICWRNSIASRLHASYFYRLTSFRLNTFRGDLVDNPCVCVWL